jgi:hypothetical protein
MKNRAFIKSTLDIGESLSKKIETEFFTTLKNGEAEWAFACKKYSDLLLKEANEEVVFLGGDYLEIDALHRHLEGEPKIIEINIYLKKRCLTSFGIQNIDIYLGDSIVSNPELLREPALMNKGIGYLITDLPVCDVASFDFDTATGAVKFTLEKDGVNYGTYEIRGRLK